MKFFLFILFIPFFLFSQDSNTLKFENYSIKGEDTIIIYPPIKEIEIIRFKSNDDQILYKRLKRRTLKVYPYAKLASLKLDSIYKDLEGISKKRKKKKYIKAVENWIKSDLSKDLKKLSRWEGRILSKLIFRETQISTYQLVKELKGGIHAFFWQSMAKIYDNNLKTTYQPLLNKEDKMIEHIILEAQLEGKIR
jgi:hypothetical protein